MWFRAFAVFLLFSKVQSQQQCSDSLGTCSGSRASLMQVKSLSQKLQASTGRGASTRAQTLAGFQKYTQELVDQYLDDPEATAGNVSAEVKQAIDVILSYLDKLYKDLIYFHEQDVKDAQYCANLPERCKEAHFNTSVVATIHGNQEQVRGKKKIHETCRQDLMAICSSPSCPEYHDYRKLGLDNGEDGVQFLPGCAKHGHLAHQAADGNDLTNFEDCLQPTQNWLDPLYGHYINCRCPNSQEGETCKQAEPPSEDKSRTCAQNQETYEIEKSLMNGHIRLHCGNYDNCIVHGRNKCEGDDADGISACTRISANSQARQTDNETAERIHCLLNVLVNPADDRAALLLACHDIDYSDMNAFWQIPCAVDGGVAHDLCPGETGDQCIPITEGYREENGWMLRTDDDACFNDGSYYDPCNSGEPEAADHGKRCIGVPYTYDVGASCDGWGALTENECGAKCGSNEQAPNCPKRQCYAAAFYPSSGWCHLYEASQCTTLSPVPSATTIFAYASAATIFAKASCEAQAQALSTFTSEATMQHGGWTFEEMGDKQFPGTLFKGYSSSFGIGKMHAILHGEGVMSFSLKESHCHSNEGSYVEVLLNDKVLQKLTSCEESDVAVTYSNNDRLTIQEEFGIIQLSDIQCGQAM